MTETAKPPKRDIQPLGNHIVVDPVELPSVTTGGIHLPEQAREKSGEGTVLSVGPGKMDFAGRMIAPGVKVGDRIMYLWIHGRDIKLDGRMLKIIDADEVLAILK